MATFWQTFHHESKFSPCSLVRRGGARPSPFNISTITSKVVVYTYFSSTPICTLWEQYSRGPCFFVCCLIRSQSPPPLNLPPPFRLTYILVLSLPFSESYCAVGSKHVYVYVEPPFTGWEGGGGGMNPNRRQVSLFHVRAMHNMSRGRIQRKTRCMGPYAGVDYNFTFYPLQSRLQHIYHGQPFARVELDPMPESTVSPSQGLWIWP